MCTIDEERSVKTDVHGLKFLSAKTLTVRVFGCFPSFCPDTWKGRTPSCTSLHILLLISWPFDVTCVSYCQSCVIKRDTLRAKNSPRQPMNASRYIQVRSCNYFCSGKAISITFSVRVFALSGIHTTMRMRYAAMCGLPGSIIFFDITTDPALQSVSMSFISGNLSVLSVLSGGREIL